MLSLTRLRCELQTEPLGLGETSPRLSWELSEGTQTAYRISTSSGWDSGVVTSDQSTGVAYEGPPLQSRQRITWTVTAWAETGEASASSHWEMGLLRNEDWTAQWIEGPLAGGPRSTVPATTFTYPIALDEEVVSARLYVTALGLADVRVNGTKTTDAELEPGWTDYRKRVRYAVHDVTKLFQAGDNAVEATLGSGWYAGKIGWRERSFYGERPRLLAQFEIVLKSGKTIVVGTDETWEPYVGQTLEDDLLDGEAIDARRKLTPIGKTRLAPAYEGILVAWNSPPIRPAHVVRPVSRNEKNLFDFGQNLVGRIHIETPGKGGETITLRVAERLDEGKIYTTNYRAAKSTDYFTLAEGDNDLTTRFTFHGFQYAELQGLPEAATVKAIVLSSDLEPTGSFACSEPLLNQLWKNIDWGWRGNSLDVPTDCPQRDERLGWTGDAQVFVRTAMFLSDAQTFWEKYSIDLADSQKANGDIPPVAPDPDINPSDGGTAWADAVVICPWTVYRCTGDRRILERNADTMRRWVDSLQNSSRDGVRAYEGYEGWSGFGDWLNTDAETPKELLGTAFYAHVADLMGKIERVLGRDGSAYDALSASVRSTFVREFGNRLESQTANVLALHFGLLPEASRGAALDHLVADIESRGDHLSTGFVGTPYLPHVLTEGGRLDVAYRLLLQKSWPSYLYPVTQGATTIWERWDGWTEDKGFQDVGMNSFNHYAYGAIGDWMASVVAGIDLDPEIPGYKKSLLHPRPGGGLTQAQASLKTGFGLLSSAWQIEGGRFLWTVEVPANTTATAVLPPEAGGQRHDLAPGRHTFTEAWSS